MPQPSSDIDLAGAIAVRNHVICPQGIGKLFRLSSALIAAAFRSSLFARNIGIVGSKTDDHVSIVERAVG